MKIKVFLVVATLLCVLAIGCASGGSLEILNLKETYTIGENIEFELVNHLPEKVLFCVGTQKNVNGKWKEDAPDIKEKEYKKEIKLQELKSNQKINLLWDTKNTFSVFKETPGVYRFFVCYTNPNDIKSSYYYSPEFEIR
jgi:hypothetical protein